MNYAEGTLPAMVKCSVRQSRALSGGHMTRGSFCANLLKHGKQGGGQSCHLQSAYGPGMCVPQRSASLLCPPFIVPHHSLKILIFGIRPFLCLGFFLLVRFLMRSQRTGFSIKIEGLLQCPWGALRVHPPLCSPLSPCAAYKWPAHLAASVVSFSLISFPF